MKSLRSHEPAQVHTSDPPQAPRPVAATDRAITVTWSVSRRALAASRPDLIHDAHGADPALVVRVTGDHTRVTIEAGTADDRHVLVECIGGVSITTDPAQGCTHCRVIRADDVILDALLQVAAGAAGPRVLYARSDMLNAPAPVGLGLAGGRYEVDVGA